MITPRTIHAVRPVRAAVVIWLFALCGLVGCSDKGPQRVAVKGEVRLDGRPVDHASIIFTPMTAGLAAAANIRDGKFELGLDDGPSVGDYGVRINPNEAELEEVDHTELTKADRRPRIPKVYQSEGKLTVTITGEPNQIIKFELMSTSKP